MRKVTLSFDNGPIATHTDAVVDLMDAYGIGGSFFVVGEDAVGPDARRILERTRAHGHWVCNHTWSHGDPLGWDEDADRAAREIGRAQEAIADFAHPDRFFRPNGAGEFGQHLLSRAAADYLASNGYTVVTWNNVPGDWIEPVEAWVDRALATMRTQQWSLVVLHDHLTGPMLPTLARFIEEARGEGAEFVQEFPPECVHMRRGVAERSLSAITQPDP